MTEYFGITQFRESAFEVSDINKYFEYGVGEAVGPFPNRENVRAHIYLGIYYIEIRQFGPRVEYGVIIGNMEAWFTCLQTAERHLWDEFVKDEVTGGDVCGQ